MSVSVELLRRRRIRRALGILTTLLLAWLAAGWLTVVACTSPRPSSIPPRHDFGGRPVEEVETSTADGVVVRAWLAVADPRRVVIVLAGARGNRLANVGIAEHVIARGWSVLLPDLRGTGESGGDGIGLGWTERRDVTAWIAFARQRGFEEIGLIGRSAGGAAVLFALDGTDERPAFVVLDSVYDDLRNALYHRLPWVPLPSLTLWPVHAFGSRALGASLDDLRPIDRVGALPCPVLVVAGDADPFARPDETQALADACGPSPATLVWMPTGGHEDLWERFPEAYGAALDRLLR